jgi:hypothetical protein
MIVYIESYSLMSAASEMREAPDPAVDEKTSVITKPTNGSAAQARFNFKDHPGLVGLRLLIRRSSQSGIKNNTDLVLVHKTNTIQNFEIHILSWQLTRRSLTKAVRVM